MNALRIVWFGAMSVGTVALQSDSEEREGREREREMGKVVERKVPHG